MLSGQVRLYVFKTMRFPPALWLELEELVPKTQRSAVLHEALRRELRQLKMRAARQAEDAKKPAAE
jgi:hypothetical protein